MFLAEGLPRRERLMFVSADPKPHLWPARLLASGALRIASVAEVYGAVAAVDAGLQKKVFIDVLNAALDDGYSGIRVVADNTRMISTAEQIQAWIEWEMVADELMARHPITGLCGFDRSSCSPDRMLEVMDLHRTHAPPPPLRP